MTDFAGLPSLDSPPGDRACGSPRSASPTNSRPAAPLEVEQGPLQGQCAEGRQAGLAGRDNAFSRPVIVPSPALIRRDVLGRFLPNPQRFVAIKALEPLPASNEVTCAGKPRKHKLVVYKETGELPLLCRQVLRLTAIAGGYDVASIRSRSHRHALVVMRMVIALTLHSRGVRSEDIADTINRERTTAIHTARQAENFASMPHHSTWNVRLFHEVKENLDCLLKAYLPSSEVPCYHIVRKFGRLK